MTKEAAIANKDLYISQTYLAIKELRGKLSGLGFSNKRGINITTLMDDDVGKDTLRIAIDSVIRGYLFRDDISLTDLREGIIGVSKLFQDKSLDRIIAKADSIGFFD